MTVRHLLAGAVLAAATTLFAASSASAQNFNLSVQFQPGPTATQLITNSNTSLTALNGASGSFTAPSGAQLALYNIDNTSTDNVVRALSGSYTTSVAVTNINNGQTISQTLIANFQGNVSNGSTSANPGFPNFNVASLTYNFSNGDVLTFNGFGFSLPGATGSPTLGAVSANSSSFTRGTVAPEPGSLALVATGLMGAMGMVVRRRRSSK